VGARGGTGTRPPTGGHIRPGASRGPEGRPGPPPPLPARLARVQVDRRVRRHDPGPQRCSRSPLCPASLAPDPCWLRPMAIPNAPEAALSECWTGTQQERARPEPGVIDIRKSPLRRKAGPPDSSKLRSKPRGRPSSRLGSKPSSKSSSQCSQPGRSQFRGPGSQAASVSRQPASHLIRQAGPGNRYAPSRTAGGARILSLSGKGCVGRHQGPEQGEGGRAPATGGRACGTVQALGQRVPAGCRALLQRLPPRMVRHPVRKAARQRGAGKAAERQGRPDGPPAGTRCGGAERWANSALIHCSERKAGNWRAKQDGSPPRGGRLGVAAAQQPRPPLHVR